MNGQWIGRFAGPTPGSIVLNVDRLESSYEGLAYLLNDDGNLPATAAFFSVPADGSDFIVKTTCLLALDPLTLQPIPLNDIQTRYGAFSRYADVKGKIAEDTLTLSWATDIGVKGECVLERSKAGAPSEVVAEEMDWDTYKQMVDGLLGEQQIFRGQNDRFRLRTSYHRRGRAQIGRFVELDMPMLLRKLSARTKHVFNIANPDENGAFLNLLQHHGYPTPLLDWSYSPYVAAFFAYRGISNEHADSADSKRKVRIYLFDQLKWKSTFESYLLLNCPKLHITVAEFMAIENERLIPQQAVTTVTNIDDIESYVRQRENQSGLKFLRAIDLQVAERRHVVRELSFMGITAGSMFPGLDGMCEELRERNFGR